MILETGIGSPNNPETARSANHLAALAKEARDRKLAETQRMLTSNPPGSDLASLEKLLADPTAVKKRVSELRDAERRSNDAAAAAQRATEAAQHAETNLAAREQASAAKIEKDERDHQQWVASERKEILAERATVTRLKNEADADRVAAPQR